jgi:hypothetical protein
MRTHVITYGIMTGMTRTVVSSASPLDARTWPQYHARRRQRVIAALSRAHASGTEISVSGIARAALLTELGREFQQFSG